MKGSISIVGAGRVGRTLGRILHRRGWHIAAVATQSLKTARTAVRAIGAGTPMSMPAAASVDANVVLVSTPDDEIAGAAEALARMDTARWRGRIVLHTSGALDRRALAPLARSGAFTGSMHPMQTFPAHGAPRLKGIVFAIGGDLPARRMAARIARELGGVPVSLRSEAKPAYHAAGALAAGHALALIEAATEILITLGFSRRRAVNALLPLTRQMLDNFERFGPRAAWTGPLARGDFATIKKHMDALRGMPPEFLDAYRALSRLAARTLSARTGPLFRQLEKSVTQPQRRIR